MNHIQLIKEVAKQSGVSLEICEVVLKSYERYSESNITQSSAKYVDTIVTYISKRTLIEKETCEAVMTTFFTIAKQQIKTKLPFMK